MGNKTWRTMAVTLLLVMSLLGTVAATGKERIGWAVIDRLTVLEGGAEFNSDVSFLDGELLLGDGTAAAPALSWFSDTNNGLYRPGDDQIGVTFSGANVQTWKEFGASTITTNTTTYLWEIADTTNVMTAGTNSLAAVNIDLGIGNSTGGTNSVYGLLVDGITGDASNTETAISVGTGWDNAAVLLGPVTVGADGTAYDVVFYSDTPGDYMRYDQSAEALIITGTAAANALSVADGNVSIVDDLDVGGTANLDAVDIDDAVQIDAAVTLGTDGTSFDMIWYSDTAGDYMRWDQSAEALVITGTAGANALNVADGNVYVADNMTMDGVFTVYNDAAITMTLEVGGGYGDANGGCTIDETGEASCDGGITVDGQASLAAAGVTGDLEVGDWFILDVGAATISITGTEQVQPATGSYMLVACTLGGGCTPASPALANGTAVGQILILQITGSNDITLTDDANLQLGAATRVLTAAKGDLIMLMWNGTDWFELSFTDIN